MPLVVTDATDDAAPASPVAEATPDAAARDAAADDDDVAAPGNLFMKFR